MVRRRCRTAPGRQYAAHTARGRGRVDQIPELPGRAHVAGRPLAVPHRPTSWPEPAGPTRRRQTVSGVSRVRGRGPAQFGQAVWPLRKSRPWDTRDQGIAPDPL